MAASRARRRAPHEQRLADASEGMEIADLWYKNAIIYCLDVETFMDGNGDGVGDFAGLTDKLDYLAGLGVTCLWLQPFYPSPNRDNGYDVSDYYGVDPKHGTPGEFVEFMNHAEQLGMRVIADLVVNHTSDRHPWFQSARKDPELTIPRLVSVVEVEAARTGTKGWCFQACRRRPGREMRSPVSTTFTASTIFSRTWTRPIRMSGARSCASWASGCSLVSVVSAWTRCRS